MSSDLEKAIIRWVTVSFDFVRKSRIIYFEKEISLAVVYFPLFPKIWTGFTSE